MIWLNAMGLFGLRRWMWVGIAVIGIGLALTAIVDAIGDAREAKILQERTQDAIEGEKRANAADKDRKEARETASQATQDELEKIHADDPEAATKPAAAGSRAVAGRLSDD